MVEFVGYTLLLKEIDYVAPGIRNNKKENPRNEKIVNQAIKEIDDNLRRLKERQDLKTLTRLKEEGEKLKERIKKFGSAPASHLFLVGKK